MQRLSFFQSFYSARQVVRVLLFCLHCCGTLYGCTAVRLFFFFFDMCTRSLYSSSIELRGVCLHAVMTLDMTFTFHRSWFFTSSSMRACLLCVLVRCFSCCRTNAWCTRGASQCEVCLWLHPVTLALRSVLFQGDRKDYYYSIRVSTAAAVIRNLRAPFLSLLLAHVQYLVLRSRTYPYPYPFTKTKAVSLGSVF